MSGGLARRVALKSTRRVRPERPERSAVMGSRVEWTVHGSLAVAVNWPLNTAFRIEGAERKE